MAELRNLQANIESPLYETSLGAIYDVKLVQPGPVITAMTGQGPFVSCGTTHGYSIDLSLDDMIKLGKWWEANKEQVLAAQKEENNAK